MEFFAWGSDFQTARKKKTPLLPGEVQLNHVRFEGKEKSPDFPAKMTNGIQESGNASAFLKRQYSGVKWEEKAHSQGKSESDNKQPVWL